MSATSRGGGSPPSAGSEAATLRVARWTRRGLLVEVRLRGFPAKTDRLQDCRVLVFDERHQAEAGRRVGRRPWARTSRAARRITARERSLSATHGVSLLGRQPSRYSRATTSGSVMMVAMRRAITSRTTSAMRNRVSTGRSNARKAAVQTSSDSRHQRGSLASSARTVRSCVRCRLRGVDTKAMSENRSMRSHVIQSPAIRIDSGAPPARK